MKVSVNTISHYTDINLTIDELVAKINAQLGGVEEVIDLGEKYKDARIVKVVKCAKHPNADKLSVCKVDDGGVVKDVPRDDDGLVEVVCGAPNVHANMWAVWLPPQSTVPATFGDVEPFVLSARELRGVVSQGMLAAGDELAINSDHAGIVEITKSDVQVGTELTPGASFAKVFGLDDTIIDIENKMFTHRPDLFGQLGVAREIAGIQHHQFTSPEEYLSTPHFEAAEGLVLETFNDAMEQSPRFMTVALKNVKIQPSPLWLQAELVRLGAKPINNVVDLTNYVMLHTAQPTHAYDYDKLRGNKLGVRMAKGGEKIKLLNGKTYELTGEDIVIVDGEGPVGLAGIMGGGDSEVSDETKNIVLEVANFDMYTLRRSSMRHGVFTDALARFNKGQSPLQNGVALRKLVSLVEQIAGGTQASVVGDASAEPTTSTSINVSVDFIQERLGINISSEEVQALLRNVELDVDEYLNVTPPFWRRDLELPEDIVEEVGRLYGFDKLPRELPGRTANPVPRNKKRLLEQSIRDTLARAGANEVLTYSFVHERVMKAAAQNVEQAYKVTNAISPDLQYYRLSITPSLLEKVHGNIKAGYDELALFEIGKSHTKTAELVDGVPPEQLRVGFVYAAKNPSQGAAYYHAKRYLDYLTDELGLTIEYKPLPESNLAAAQPFDVVRRARVIDAASGYPIAIIGEYSATATTGFKLPAYAAGFELLTEGIQRSVDVGQQSGYKPLSRYPSTSRDVTLRVGSEVSYSQLYEALHFAKVDEAVRYIVEPKGIYQADGDDAKHVTVHMTIASDEKTLTSDEASEIVSVLTASAADIVQATVV